MTLPPFDGSAYRQTVLTPLRSGTPASVDDVFWLAHLPRETDDVALIAGRLKETKAFLHKERARPRQADVAAAVLKEWARVEGVLTDSGARRSLRTRLAGAAPPALTDAARPSGAPGSGGAAPRSAGAGDPAARRRQQVSSALGELARLRDEPDLAEDLFAFLGLPFTSTTDMTRARIAQIGDVNRRRRPDRERSLVDELLMHARDLLVDGDPQAYRAGLAGEPEPDQPAEAASGAEAAMTSQPLARSKRTRGLTPPAPAPAPSAAPLSRPVSNVRAVREPEGIVLVTWDWPFGVTEVFVAVGPAATPETTGPAGRKITNTKYAVDGGARLEGVPAATPITVHSGRRDQGGRLIWNAPEHARGTMTP